jgi:hypothetical protein
MYRLDVECQPLSHEIHLLSNNLSEIISLRPFLSRKTDCNPAGSAKKTGTHPGGRMPVAEIVSL